MKKIIKLCLTIVLSCLVFSIAAFASEDADWEEALRNADWDKESILLPQGVKLSDDYTNGLARGQYISSSCVSISNEGYSTIGIYADTTAHVNVKKIQIRIYLDQWDELKKDWVKVEQYDYVSEYKEGGKQIHDLTVYFDEENYPSGYYYRLRGMHAVWSFDGKMESHSTSTDGIFITAGPA